MATIRETAAAVTGNYSCWFLLAYLSVHPTYVLSRDSKLSLSTLHSYYDGRYLKILGDSIGGEWRAR
jgi:hypothetical protein